MTSIWTGASTSHSDRLAGLPAGSTGPCRSTCPRRRSAGVRGPDPLRRPPRPGPGHTSADSRRARQRRGAKRRCQTAGWKPAQHETGRAISRTTTDPTGIPTRRIDRSLRRPRPRTSTGIDPTGVPCSRPIGTGSGAWATWRLGSPERLQPRSDSASCWVSADPHRSSAAAGHANARS